MIDCILDYKNQDLSLSALVNTEASGIIFIDEIFVHQQNYLLVFLSISRILKVVNGWLTAFRNITHHVQLSFSVESHFKMKFELLVTQLDCCSIILDYLWLQQHQAHLDFDLCTLTFFHKSCKFHCFSFSVSVFWKNIEPESCHQESELHSLELILKNLQTSACENMLTLSIVKFKALEICMIGSTPFMWIVKKKNHEIFAISIKNIKKVLNSRQLTDSATVLSEEYHEFLDVFSKQLANSLPSHWLYNHHIHLKPDSQSSFGSLYGMFRNELLIFKKYLNDNLFKRFIHTSLFSAISPVLFIHKPKENLHFCVDYRE